MKISSVYACSLGAILKSQGVCRNIKEGTGRRYNMTFYLYKEAGGRVMCCKSPYFVGG